ncbi:protein kinase [Streptomyces sanglieri]|uniref:non-specific serine/threonine protein kinase n=1 Tax=Streptomyces sanglieri TaxID=193460 RepID=A0ABW2X500_9ACTN
MIDDRFELVNRLGSGGMGMVWRAHDLALHRDVALKEVRPPDPALSENDPESARLLRERVLREARALARLDHPGVVTVHHIVDGGDGTYPWIVMELVPGASLAERLAEGTLSPVEAAELGRGCCPRCGPPMPPESCTATSSPPMCCCGPTGARCSPTSASRRSASPPV